MYVVQKDGSVSMFHMVGNFLFRRYTAGPEACQKHLWWKCGLLMFTLCVCELEEVLACKKIGNREGYNPKTLGFRVTPEP